VFSFVPHLPAVIMADASTVRGVSITVTDGHHIRVPTWRFLPCRSGGVYPFRRGLLRDRLSGVEDRF